MDMTTLTSGVPLIGAVLFVVCTLVIAFKGDTPMKKIWLFPAALSLLFLLFSLEAIATEGLLGFWPVHSQSLWGNQVWLDLLIAIGIGWTLMVPQAKALGMKPWPWLVLIVATGSIGTLAMLARLLYLRENSEQQA